MLCALVELAASCGLAHVAVIWTVPTCTAWRGERPFYFYCFQYYSIVGNSDYYQPRKPFNKKTFRGNMDAWKYIYKRLTL